ncbi:hypothetical protein NM688_g4176 [Phlebia brevispora]|uniref:Uncharacterized protein n=1 Tax=Phlebia brevispora TaxID=194682 RepID=A0ACC1T3L2_9APHY|nr:hypothetical protein NM688_g4176 [Phlebia brevispora]
MLHHEILSFSSVNQSLLVDLIVNKKTVGGDWIESLDKDKVGEFLRKHLHWRVSALGHKEIDITNIPSLKVSVAVATATLPIADDKFVQYGDFEVLDKVTSGRLSGFNSLKDNL